MKNAGFIVAMALLASACGPGPSGGPGGEPDGSPSGTAPPAANGAIAFVRLDPDDAVADGVIPPASLVLVTPEGRERVLATVTQATPAWSPDGSTLAYAGEGGIRLLVPGDEPHRLTRCDPSSCVGDGPPGWSPDGRTVVFGSDRAGSEGLWTVPATGGVPVLLAGGLSVHGPPSWAPDGSTIAVVATPHGGGGAAVVLIDPASGSPSATLTQPGGSFGGTVLWSSDGSTLLVTASVGAQAAEAVYVMRPDGSDLRLLTACPDAACIDVWPAWSPDGELVVFTRGRCDQLGSDCFSGDLYVIPADGGRPRRLTEGPGLDCCAAWQPVPGG